MILFRITRAPGGRNGFAKIVGPTATQYHLLRHDEWELVEADDLPRQLEIFTPFRPGEPGYETLQALERAITHYLRRAHPDAPIEVAAQLVSEGVSDEVKSLLVEGDMDEVWAEFLGKGSRPVIWVTYPAGIELTDELITNLPRHFFYDLPPGMVVEFVLEPVSPRFAGASS